MSRMKILNSLEQEAFDSPPNFNSWERKHFFDFPSGILKLAATLKNPANTVYFLAMAGYFKATKKFFGFKFHKTDLLYIAKSQQTPFDEVLPNTYFKQTASRHRYLILDFYGFKEFDLPNIYLKTSDSLHTSSDGQKFEVEKDSLNASYSFKYFGGGKGVSVYTFIDERNLLFHSNVITAAEWESHYAIDGLMFNDVVKSNIHSTDTHGYSEVIFATMHLLGFSFAPRIKDFQKQRLYTFETRRSYKEQGYPIIPDGYINTKLISDNSDDILRFIATIKLKVTTASDLFRCLNSYLRQHNLYKALKEFGKIPKSQHILRWIDDVTHRQAVEKQLNRIEHSHRLSRAVNLANPYHLSFSDKQEQEIAEDCRRLIKNAIICWNYLYLSQKLSDENNFSRKRQLFEAIRNGSVVCWRHINMLGEYDFSEQKLQDSFGFQLPKILTLDVPNSGS